MLNTGAWQEKEAALKREREEAVKRAENDMTDLERFRSRGVAVSCGGPRLASRVKGQEDSDDLYYY